MFIQDLYFFSSFTLAKKRRKEVPRKEENQAGFRTLRVHYATLWHCLQNKHPNKPLACMRIKRIIATKLLELT